MNSYILYPIIIPVIAALLVLVTPGKDVWIKGLISLAGVTVNLIFAILLFGENVAVSIPLIGYGFDFSLRLYHFSSFIILASAGFSFLIVLYSLVFMKGKNNLKLYYLFLLITVAMVNGATLANNLFLMLFFWEGLLITTFVLIMAGGKKSFPTAVKALVLVGVSDLCMTLGIIITGQIAGTFAMDRIHLPMNYLGSIAFILLMIGAVAKAGSMPFHSWIPDAALDAPLPFMAFLPAALEKLLGNIFPCQNLS